MARVIINGYYAIICIKQAILRMQLMHVPTTPIGREKGPNACVKSDSHDKKSNAKDYFIV